MSTVPRYGRSRFTLIGLLVVCVVGYAFFLARYISPHAAGSDPSGYLHSARLMSQGRLLALPRVLPGYPPAEFGPRAIEPLGFMLRPDGLMAPTYPTGYPLQLIVAAVFGWKHAATVLNVITATVSGLLLFNYGRRLGLNVWSALGGVALLWSCPLFLFSTFQPMSDLSALGWSLAVCYFAMGTREDWRNGILCGLAFGLSVLVRPTNVLLILPLVVAFGLHWRLWLSFGIGAVPGAALLGFSNWRLYGSPFATGYGDISSIFGRGYLPHNLSHFSRWIPVLLTPLVILSVVAPIVAAARTRGLAILSVWALTIIGFYVFYYHAGETWWYLRFILPAFPALILATMVVLQTGWERTRRWPIPAAISLAAAVAGAAGWQFFQTRKLDVLHLEAAERSYPDAAHWAQENLPAGSVLFCMQVSGAFYYYTEFLFFRWDLITPEKNDLLLAAVARQNRPVYAALFSFETPEALDRIGGHWTALATVGQVTFWQRQP